MTSTSNYDTTTSQMPRLFGGVYVGRRVLVTGHTGFKGSWLTLWLQAMGANVTALSLPPDTTPSHYRILDLQLPEATIDIRDARAVRDAIAQFKPEIVFHLAAQSLVRASYSTPVQTFDVNVMGLVNVLEAVRATPSVRAVVSVTSDKCYRNRHTTEGYVEDDALGGHDPYSASKACAEIVSASYRASFLEMPRTDGTTVALATARAGNVVGGGDWAADRLIPDLVRNTIAGKSVALRSPHAVRPWQHVLEPLSGYLVLGERLLDASTASATSGAWNFGPDADGHVTVQQLVEQFAHHWDAIKVVIDDASHPHEAELLHLNCDKANRELAWRSVWDTTTTLERTATWYREWYASNEVRTRSDLHQYVHDASALGLNWARA